MSSAPEEASAPRAFTFGQNRTRLLRSPLYALAALVSLLFPRDADLWLFGRKNGVGEGPLAVYTAARELLPPTTRLVWIAQDPEQLAAARERGMEAHLVTSPRAVWLTLRAGVVVLAYGLGDVVRACAPGAHIVQTWHGAPLKKICLDSPVSMGNASLGRLGAGVYQLLFQLAGRLIRTIPAGSDTVAARFQTAWRWPDRGRIAVVGDPRCDVLGAGDPAAARDAARAVLQRLWGVSTMPSRLALYAPTWRDGADGPGLGPDDLTPELCAALTDADAVLVVRAHPWGTVAGSEVVAHTDRVRFASSGDVSDVMPLLPAFDLLITDYSAIAIDFARLGRPQLFYAPDLEAYERERGLYEPYAEFTGGRHFDDWAALLTTACEVLTDPEAEAAVVADTSTQIARRYHHFADGRAAHRLVEHVRARVR